MSSTGEAEVSLARGMLLSGLSYLELWLRYVAVGGEISPMELEAYVSGLLRVDRYQHDVIAQALNEYFMDAGQDHPVAYST